MIQFSSHVRARLLEGIRYLSLFLSLHPRADAISDEGVAFSADPIVYFERRGCIFGSISSEEVAFPTTGTDGVHF